MSWLGFGMSSMDMDMDMDMDMGVKGLKPLGQLHSFGDRPRTSMCGIVEVMLQRRDVMLTQGSS